MRRFSITYNLLAIFLLIAVSALTYLPWLNRISYMNDDWYLMYAAKAYGPFAFIDIFKVDRPARAGVMMIAYTLFGDNPLYYNLSAYIFRLIAVLAFFWLLQMLWPYRRNIVFFSALLFLLYPGFLSQNNGIDYQSQMASLAAALLSIALSVNPRFANAHMQAQLLKNAESCHIWRPICSRILSKWSYDAVFGKSSPK